MCISIYYIYIICIIIYYYDPPFVFGVFGGLSCNFLKRHIYPHTGVYGYTCKEQVRRKRETQTKSTAQKHGRGNYTLSRSRVKSKPASRRDALLTLSRACGMWQTSPCKGPCGPRPAGKTKNRAGDIGGAWWHGRGRNCMKLCITKPGKIGNCARNNSFAHSLGRKTRIFAVLRLNIHAGRHNSKKCRCLRPHLGVYLPPAADRAAAVQTRAGPALMIRHFGCAACPTHTLAGRPGKSP